MKLLTFPGLLILLSSAIILSGCLREYDTATFEVTDFDLSAATTQTNDGMPVATTDTISRSLFALQSHFTITSNLSEISYDYYESSVIMQNPIDSLCIWSDTVFMGIPAGNLLNDQFYLFKNQYGQAAILNNNSGLNLARPNAKTPYYETVYFVCNHSPEAGRYRFFVSYYLENGLVLIDSTQKIILE